MCGALSCQLGFTIPIIISKKMPDSGDSMGESALP
jgi:hypothetical protein